MRSTNRYLIGGGIVTISATAFVGLLVASVERPKQQQTLSDGRRVSLAGVTTPARPKLITGPPLFRLFAPAIPESQYERLGLKPFEQTHSPLTLWVNVRKPGEQSDPRFLTDWATMPLDFASQKVISDDLGNTAVIPIDLWMGHRRMRQGIESVFIDRFPRRGTSLKICLTQEYATREVVEFRIANPDAGPFPEWPAETLPATCEQGDLQVELLSAHTGLPAYSPTGATRGALDWTTPQSRWTFTEFAVRERGRPTNSWIPTLVEIRDATGNGWSNSVMADSLPGGRCKAWFIDNLWNEPSWKLRFRFARVSGESPDRRAGLRALLPRRGRRMQSTPTVSKCGVKLKAGVALAPGDVWRLANGVIVPPTGPFVDIRLQGPIDDRLIRLVEVSGRRFRRELDLSGEELGPDIRRYALPGDTPPGLIWMTFLVQEPRYFEYTVHVERSKSGVSVSSR